MSLWSALIAPLTKGPRLGSTSTLRTSAHAYPSRLDNDDGAVEVLFGNDRETRDDLLDEDGRRKIVRKSRQNDTTMAGWRVDELVSELDVPSQDSETPLLSKLKDPRVGLSAQSLVTDVNRVVPSRAQRRRQRSADAAAGTDREVLSVSPAKSCANPRVGLHSSERDTSSGAGAKNPASPTGRW